MAKGYTELQSAEAGDLLYAIKSAARTVLGPQYDLAFSYKLKLVCPQFAATPFRIVVDTETKQVEIHFDY